MSQKKPFLSLVLLAGASVVAAGSQPPATAETTTAAAGVAVQPPASIAHLDPQTGRLVPRPAVEIGSLSAAAQQAMRTDDEGLREESSPVPGGGVVLHLQGRFRPLQVIGETVGNGLTQECIQGIVTAVSGGEPANPHDREEASDAS